MSEINVRIAGNHYILRGDSGEAHLRKAAQLLDGKLLAISKANPQYGSAKAAVLAALQLTDELLKVNEQFAQLQREVDALTRD